MNAMEQRLSELLKAAPDEPPTTLDADTIVGRHPRRRRLVAPALAAAAVVAVAIGAGVALSSHSTRRPAADVTHRPIVTVLGPRARAVKAVAGALESAPLPPGAVLIRRQVAGLNAPFSEIGSPNEVRRTRWYTASGGAAATITYVKAHPPAGMTLGATGHSSGAGARTVDGVEFETSGRLTLAYTITAYGGGVAIRVDAITIWVRDRPHWSYVAAPVTSVDVTVIRTNPQLHEGAPTVHRTLRGAAARSLAERVNRTGLSPDYGPRHCPAALLGERWSDTLVFHTPSGTWRVLASMVGCSSVSITDGRHDAVLLDTNPDRAVLTALGLPADYGH